MLREQQKLPACERCRVRKVKCDKNAPKCTACTRNNVACVIVDFVTGSRYSRENVAELERRLEALEARASTTQTASPAKSPATSSKQRQEKTHFIGDGSGLWVFDRLSSASEATLRRPTGVRDDMVPTPSAAASFPISQLPPWDLARVLKDRFYSHMHLHHPFLDPATVEDAMRRLYHEPTQSPDPQDMYRAFMIFAVSSVTLYRKGETPVHPYSFYRAAQQYFSKVSFFGSLGAIQNLLLIARFAMYYHIDCSIWDIARLCMRQCVELELQRPPKHALTPLEEQVRRNIFWDSYVHDRYSSGILGRPYAIAEQDIEVGPPIEAPEDFIAASDAPSLNQVDLSAVTKPNGFSVFLFVLRLRRLTTRVSTRFFSSRSQTTRHQHTIADIGRVKADLNRFLVEFDEIYATSPRFQHQGSLYERPQWYQFLVEKDKLTLIRGALAQMSIGGLPPPHSILDMCLRSAVDVIELYHNMFAKGWITWTRSYFQILFTSGLAIMHSLSLFKDTPLPSRREGASRMARAAEALRTASELLQLFVMEMPDANRFARVFDALVKQYLESRSRPSGGASPIARAADNLTDAAGFLRPAAAAQNDTHGSTRSQAATYSGAPQTTMLPSEVPSTQPTQDSTGNGAFTSSNGNGNAFLEHDPVTAGFPTNQQQHHESNNDHGLASFNFDDVPNWYMIGGMGGAGGLESTSNLLGYMEAGLGEYAWGAPPDDTLWDQWDQFWAPAAPAQQPQ